MLKRITTNLKNGKHVILTGPPGTGKSKLAKEICQKYVGKNYNMVTATSDWSTFDTIGGYRPNRNGNLNFNSGVFLDCFKKDKQPGNDWLIIDEINRADIDKAFGSLFSALTGDPITLSFKTNNNKNIRIKPQEFEKIMPEEHLYVIPEDWRIIATMNTFDKTSLYEMSYAFMRRFAFIPVSIPQEINPTLVKNYLDCWGIENYQYVEQVSKLWNKINNTRKIGQKKKKNIYSYLLDNYNDYSSVIISYVLPQFEGVRKNELYSFINELKELGFITDQILDTIQNFVDDYFRLGGQ